MHDKRKNVALFLQKIIKHKMFDEEEVKDIWYQGVVTEVLDDDETNAIVILQWIMKTLMTPLRLS